MLGFSHKVPHLISYGSGTDVGSPDLLRAETPLVSQSIQPQTMIYAKRMAVELTQSATWPER